MKNLAPVLAAFLLLSPVAAQAAEAPLPWYWSFSGSYSIMPDSDSRTHATPSVTGTTDMKGGYGANLAVGMPLPNSFRLELEGGYIRNNIDSLSSGGGTAAASGKIETWTGLLNVYYDLKTNTPWSPYIGAGLGAARHHEEVNLPVAGGQIIDDTDTVFAYQASAGLSYAVNPSTTVFTGYRFYAESDPEITSTTGGVVAEREVRSHLIQAGVRFGF